MNNYDDIIKNKKITDFEIILPVSCPRCGYVNTSADYYCNKCGCTLKKFER